MAEDAPSPAVLVLDLLNDDEAVHALLCPHCWAYTGAWLASPSGEATCIVCDGRFSVSDRRA